MNIKNYAIGALLMLFFIALPACKTMPQKPGANAMRIWIAPAYRTNTAATATGHVYVEMQGETATTSSTNKTPVSYRR